jgi:hypothetical protein
MFFAPAFFAILVISNARAQSVSDNSKPSTAAVKAPVVPYRYRTHAAPNQARQFYAETWGVDALTVKSVESGKSIRFSYRVLDPDKAKVLNDKRNEPFLMDPGAGVKLPGSLSEKAGEAGQGGRPESGKVYWIAFSNQGRSVHPGHRVDVIVGQFRATRLIVH